MANFDKYYNKKYEKGQTLVEFSLILLLILILLFGVTEFGKGWYYSNAIENGVRAGARFASTQPNNFLNVTSVKNFTFAQITSAIPRGDMTTDFINVSAFRFIPPSFSTSVPITTFDNLTGEVSVTVIARYNFNIVPGNPSQQLPLVGGTKTITKQATMRYEHD